jgi:beta-glucosidase/6-phospho-beta-glucosidase/beta-galactosidase
LRAEVAKPSDGFASRFGFVHVDYKTQKRTPKLSAAYFSRGGCEERGGLADPPDREWIGIGAS